MLLETSYTEFVTSFQSIWLGVIGFLPVLIVAILVFIIGWIIAVLIEKGLNQFFSIIKLDGAVEATGLNEMAGKAGVRIRASRLISAIVKWFFILVFLVAALDIVGLSQVNVFLQEVLGYLPQVLIAVLVIVIASLVSDGLGKAVSSSARIADLKVANLLGQVVRWSIWVFAIIISLGQLGIATQFVEILFTGIVAMLAIAGGLAFGLGGKEVARDTLESIRGSISSKKQ